MLRQLAWLLEHEKNTMFNLLLNKDKIFLLREYKSRVAVVIVCLASGVVAIGIVLLIPSYVWTHVLLQSSADRLADLKQVQAGAASADLQRTLLEGKRSIAMLSGSQPLDMTGLIKSLTETRVKGIKISDVEYAQDVNTASIPKIQISGIAATRQNLLDFTDALKKNAHFSGVNLPLSSFVKDKDIEFSIQMNVVQ